MKILGCLLAAFVMASLPGTAHALCPNQQKLVVAQSPDVFFTAGVAATQYVPVVYAVRANSSASDCGVMASTTLPGLLMVENYCNWGQNCAVGTSVKVVSDAGFPGDYVFYEQDHVRQIEVRYDGTTPAGTVGTIDLTAAVDGSTATGDLLGKINVYFVNDPAPSSWFTVQASAGSVSGDSLILDHPLLNNKPTNRVFVTHVYNGTNWPRQIATWYDHSLGKWKIRNEDGTAMPVGLSFHVHPDPSALRLQTARFGSYTYITIDNPISNNNPFATIVVTPHTTGTRRLLHPIQVAYAAPYWVIQTANGQPFPTSDAFGNTVGFSVKLMGASKYVDDNTSTDPSGFVDTENSNGAGVDIRALSTRKSGNYKILNKFCFSTGSPSPLGRPSRKTKPHFLVTPQVEQ